VRRQPTVRPPERQAIAYNETPPHLCTVAITAARRWELVAEDRDPSVAPRARANQDTAPLTVSKGAVSSEDARLSHDPSTRGEDQPIFRDGLVHILQQAGFEILGAVGDASELLAQIHAHTPDVVISDIQMPPGRADDGLQAVLEARLSHPELGVLMLSQYLDSSYAFELVAGNARGVGYLLKEKVADSSTVIDAVNRVAEGGTVLDPDVVEALVRRPRKSGPLDTLTRRERVVLELIAQDCRMPALP